MATYLDIDELAVLLGRSAYKSDVTFSVALPRLYGHLEQVRLSISSAGYNSYVADESAKVVRKSVKRGGTKPRTLYRNLDLLDYVTSR